MSNASASVVTESHGPSTSAQRIAALQSIEELEGLTREELQWIADAGTERFVADGGMIFSQESPPHHMIFVLAGELAIKRHTSSSVSVLMGRTRRITGQTPFSRTTAWNADGRASGSVWLLELHRSQFPALLAAIPSMTERIVHILVERNREYTRAEGQLGKLSALSKLAGNLAHELNNPASAARSASLALKQNAESATDGVRYQIGLSLLEQTAIDSYVQRLDAIRARVIAGPRQASGLDGELEEALSDWLSSKDSEVAWKLSPILAEAEVSIAQLEEFLTPVPPQLQLLALKDLLATVSQDAAIASVIRATERIFRVVSAVKDYSYMDRQPLQDVDIPAALDNVLMMLQPRLKNVVVKKNFAPGLPHLQGFGSELNLAFSALIENSLDAMSDKGTLTLSARLQGDTFLIEVEDDGRGIPVECQDRIFEPFFTTKPFGEGLGLGLDTVQRVLAKHLGAVAYDTSARGTIFHVRLPTDRMGIY